MTFAAGRRPLFHHAVALLALAVIATGNAAAGIAAEAGGSGGYRIAPGDRIAVSVFGQPELSGEAVVDQDGNLRLPIVGSVAANALTPAELEARIAAALTRGYVRNPAVSIRITDFRPVYVLGLVRIPGSYPYRQGLSALGAIALAGGIGAPEDRRGALVTELLQAEERVRQLEISRAALTIRRARLVAEQNEDDTPAFPDLSGSVDPERLAQFVEAERRAFATERQAQRQEAEALASQIPKLEAEIVSVKLQQKLEQKQRDLNHEMVAQYESMMGSGLVRKPNYIEVKREEARLDGNIERLRSEALRAEYTIGDLKFRIGELRNNYRRRATTALQEVDRSLLELSVSIPSAYRIRVARSSQIGSVSAQQDVNRPAIAVVRGKTNLSVAFDAAGDFPLQPGDIVRVGDPLPSVADAGSDALENPRKDARAAAAPRAPTPAADSVRPKLTSN
ncbi:polysaccharide biosynthesis/export family protein [Pseudorhodoplanes sp.]|uniref:polysaccharide biosynthesis/export family protein n=1 Tax=Pseudorhodoplanes sp. TaxID=1934341 RepID=UPI002C03F4F4|nr:polysaccharide biosynthesis/export family protein [Pseudorhodoplanes sp.]HWV41634.1 polysaccharide biosynthesis/export family protein [Pseudorhodoplanes sp.]